MGCKNKKHNYSKVSMGSMDHNDISMNQMAKDGNNSIKGLTKKCLAVKRKGCKK